MQYLNRQLIKKIQTPQGFKYREILNAYNEFINLKLTPQKSFTDDFSLLLNSSIIFNHYLYNGNQSNFKITNKEDILKFKFLLQC